jgi:hypothetical protein
MYFGGLIAQLAPSAAYVHSASVLSLGEELVKEQIARPMLVRFGS